MMAVDRGAAFSRASSSLMQCGAGSWRQRTHSQRATTESITKTAPAVAKSTTMKWTKYIDRHPFAFMTLASAFALFFVALVALAIHGLIA